MAATIQAAAQQQPPPSNNKSSANPQLKRIVYSKYRELLGSYNDKANAIIETLPAYMVKEDRGFHFDPKIIDEVDKVVYGTPPAPPPLSTGSLPTQRLSTQTPQYNVGEAPACVQNAMMTKDKKPFTYTPGGIDLSQIKSQRMAKRLARNAQSEGATGQQQVNRPTPPPQQQSNGGAAAGQLGATAMGMPFQVLPSGPPPPPPQPSKAGQPPPPPPAPQNKLAPQSNGNAAHARKSPTPQNFEPPPMGFRPEIKIPPNPMATLKKVPPPQEKNNFWVEEYRKERSKSPMVGNDENDYNRSPPNNPQPETNQNTYTKQNEYKPQQNQQNRSPSPQPMRQQQEYYTQRAVSPQRTPAQQLDQQKHIESPFQRQYSPQPQQQQSPSIQRQSSQYQTQYQAPQSSPQQQQSPPIQRPQTVSPKQNQGPTSPQNQQQQQTLPTQQQQQQTVPWRSQRQVAPPGIQNNVSRPRDVMSPAPSETTTRPQPQFQQQQQQYPAYLRSREVLSPGPEAQPPQLSQPYQQKNSQVGSIYIPPVATQQQQQPQTTPYQEPQGVRQQQSSRQVPANRWVSAQPTPAETQPLNRIKSPPPSSSSNGFGNNNIGLRLQINTNTSNSNVKERIIPIQLEQTPTPTRTPSAPGFGPQPFYNVNQQQYGSVPSPPSAQGTTSNGPNSPSYIVRSPNQFVDQGYNNYPPSQDPNRVTSPTMQQMQSPRIGQQTNTAGGVKTRVIPIAFDSQSDGPLNPNNVRGPISQQPLVIQNDPRNQNSWGSGSLTPNQSKSFRILQKITDTTDDNALDSKAVESDVGDQEPQLQRPTYARQMAPGQLNSPTIDQMKRMQLNNEQGFANRARNQDDDVKPTVKAANEDPRYRGPSNPSKTFKKLQGAVERCSPNQPTEQDGTSPVMKQPQPNRYVNQKPVYSPEEQSQQYVHPSEQQVPEPKKYTGSAIPSRSFKILQAMTTPENAAEMEGSDVVESNKSITECPYQQPPTPYAYPYPYLPPCCLPPPPPPPPNSSSGGDANNWQYPLTPHHHHHHPHQHHPHQYHAHQHHQHHPHQHHPYPPCPCYYYYPPNEYDSQNCIQYQDRDSLSRGNSQSKELPNIIITPSAEDIPEAVKGGIGFGREQREGSVIETLSRRLNEITKPVDLDLNMSQEDDKQYVGDCGKEFSSSPSSIKSECENNNISSDDSSDDLLTSSTDESTTSSSEDCAQQLPNDGLQAIKSVTNIQVYNKKGLSPMDAFDDDRTVDEGESMIFDDEDEEEEEIVAEELEYDEEEVLVEEIESEEEDDIEELDEDEEHEVIAIDDLSVIYEENEADAVSPRPTSRISSTVSDTTTLANEQEVIKEDEDEDNSNSVTVRLPLKFSFSRSSNDENIATVEVGNSQIEDKRRSFSIASVEADPEEYDSDSQDCDVSVTISLSPSSGSLDRKTSLSPVSRKCGAIDTEGIRENGDSEAEDVSVAFSLPMRNKFLDQTWGGDFTNNIAIKKNKKKLESNEVTTIETWRMNSSVFEENEKKIETLQAVTTDESDGWSTRSVIDCKVPTPVAKKSEETTTLKNNSICDDRDEKAVALKRNYSAKPLVDTKTNEIKKMKVVDDTQNISNKEAKKIIESPIKDKQPEVNGGEELDFWATLQATRKEAQLFLEKTADYWGKKIDGREKAEAEVENGVINAPPTIEAQTDEDFWSTIRVKNTVEETKPAADKTVDKLEEIPLTPKDLKVKAAKPKKKKKIIKAAPEKVTEPEHVWSTINLPNANNRAKIVESTIKMIQDKAKKPKESVKTVQKEIEMGDFIAGIKVSYDKDYKEKSNCGNDLGDLKVSCEGKQSEKDVIITLAKSEKVELKSNSLFKEKAELKSQILNHKFANTFSIPEKPILMQAVLSESRFVSSTNSYDPKSSSQEIEIKIEESEKLNKPKKKTVKSKKTVEDADSDNLKPPKAKTSRKSTKESKKMKKQEEEVPIPQDTIATGVQQNIEEKPSSVIIKEKAQTIDNEAEEEPDFWAEIESSKSSETISGKKESKTDFWTETKSESNTSTDHQEVDFWATIESSKETDFSAEVESSKAKNSKETEFRSEIDNYKTKTGEEHTSSKSSNEEKGGDSTDFWAEVESLKIKSETDYSKAKKEGKIEVDYQETKIENEAKHEVIDFWADIECSKSKHLDTFAADHHEGASWTTINSFEAKNEDEHEMESHAIDICSEAESVKADEDIDFWSDIDSAKYENRKSIIENTEPHSENIVSLQKSDFWDKVDSIKDKTQEKSETETDFWSEIESSKAESEVKVPPISKMSNQDFDHTESFKSRALKTSNKMNQESDFCTETESADDIAFGIQSVCKSKKKSFLPKDNSSAQIDTPMPKTNKVTLHVYGDYDVELINMEPVSTYYAAYTEPEKNFWATVSYADNDSTMKSQVTEEKETDFWASNSSGNETEVNSEVDTGKIDFWVSQRNFETNNGFANETTSRKEEEIEEVDFWAEIKGPNDDEEKEQGVLPKEECELRRNNYKKAMAFFTNTVNADKKEESPVPSRNIDSSLIYEKEKTPGAQAYNSWTWRESTEQDWEAPEEREVNDVFLIVEDNANENEPHILIENRPYNLQEGCKLEEQPAEEDEEAPSESSESISDSTPNHFQIEHQYPTPEPESIKPNEKSVEPISNKFSEEIKISVKDRIFAFESGTIEPPLSKQKTSLIVDSATPKSNLSRNSSQRSESEIEEDDSGVTDMNKPLSETDTESESFPELRKMTRYQRASTHSRLFKLLQDDGDIIEEEQPGEDKTLEEEFNFKPRKKIVHNVSITRKQNPKALQEAESMTKRRERLSLPLRKNPSIDADNLSSPNSPASPIFGQPSQPVSDKLVNELVQSLLLKKSSSNLKNLPMEKLQAAAKRVLEEELDSLENTSLDSTPALTPQEFKSESYSDYYDSWSAKTDSDTSANGSFEILPSKAFKALQETTAQAKRRPWAVRCPRVLSSKTVNRDLARVTESPEIFTRSSNSPEINFGSERASSVGRWRKV